MEAEEEEEEEDPRERVHRRSIVPTRSKPSADDDCLFDGVREATRSAAN